MRVGDSELLMPVRWILRGNSETIRCSLPDLEPFRGPETKVLHPTPTHGKGGLEVLSTYVDSLCFYTQICIVVSDLLWELDLGSYITSPSYLI